MPFCHASQLPMSGTMSLGFALMPLRNRPNLFLLLTLLPPLGSLAYPVALSNDHNTRALGNEDDNKSGSSGGVSLQVWIPVIVVALVLTVAVAMTWTRRSLLRGLASLTATTPAPANTREVTAEQLANGIAAPGDDAGETGSGQARPARRPRRARRTPSQVSTKSLPAYNKEPGDEELVIFRGPQDMEDGSAALAVVMPSVDERDTDHSFSTSTRVSMYPEQPDTPNDMPLLHNNDTHDNDNEDDNENNLSMQNLMIPNLEQVQTRSSIDTMANSDDTDSSLRALSRAETQDPRGEAPPYFEVVSLDEQQAPANGVLPGVTTDVPSSPPASIPEAVAEFTPHRRSGLRGFFHSFSPSVSRPAIPMRSTRTSSSHTRDASDPSVMSMSTDASHGRRTPGSRSHPYHRPESTSGSIITSSPFRDPSQHSTSTLNSRMNSPSLISLNSISAPLTHTLVRTEFTYPKSGPTPQQLKLISSRESFARFGVPYGADAIAYAASSSRHELEPPPGFDAVTSEGPNQSASSLALPAPTHRRNSSADSARQLRTDLDSGASAPQNTDERSLSTPDPASSVPRQPSPLSSATTAPADTPPSTADAPTSETPPPISFRVAGPSRSQSRASSVQTFDTATENLVGSDTPDPDAVLSAQPSTSTSPHLSHLKDHTDATIMPGAVVVL